MGNTSSIEVDEPEGPCTYVLVIGINKYEHPGSSLDFEDLQTARHDAECLKAAFEYRASRSKQKRIVILPELDSSAEDIRQTVKDTVGRLSENSVFMVFFSGHAMQVPDHWTYVVPANPKGYQDCIPMESFLQECVEERKLKYVHVCCFFLCCRHHEDAQHFPDPKMVECDETNSYISVYVCREGEGLTDWCHAAQALSFLLYLGEVYELWPLLTKFREESMFLSLGSVKVEWSQDGFGETVTLFTPGYSKFRQFSGCFHCSDCFPRVHISKFKYVKIMEKSQMDCMIENAPILRLILNEVSNKELERATELNAAKRLDQIASVRKSLHDIAYLVERLVKSKHFEPIASEIKFWSMSSLQEIAAELRNMQTQPGNKDLHCEGCSIPYDALRVIREAIQATELADLEAYQNELRKVLETANQYCLDLSFESDQAAELEFWQILRFVAICV